MTDWLAGLIVHWPVWLVLTLAVIVGALWVMGEAIFYGGLSPFEKKEWWQDREKRLALKTKKKNEQRIMKKRKG
jgi:hypothetical protein